MQTDFWLQKWQKNEIGFHKSDTNPILVTYFSALELGENSRVCVPLCGKSRDIAWLLSQGHRVLGVELSELAIGQLFAELGLEPEISQQGRLRHYRADNIDIYGGDFFDLSPELVGPIDAVYDRAALVALPVAKRQLYAAHLMLLTDCAPQLLVCFEYDQSLMDGPPFAIGEAEVKQHYADSYRLTCLSAEPATDSLRGLSSVQEKVWLLR